MSDPRADLERQIAELRAQLAALELPAAPAAPAATQGATSVSGRVTGSAIGVNQGSVNLFFSTPTPGDAGKALLADYLNRLAVTCDELRLSRILKRTRTGAEGDAAPPLRLQDVFTNLTTDGELVVVHQRIRTAQQIRALLTRITLVERSPDACAPESVRILWLAQLADGAGGSRGASMLYGGGVAELPGRTAQMALDEVAPDTPLQLELVRDPLAFEAIRHKRHLVLLGEPGYGKSTVLRYLAHLLARRGCGEAVAIPGWPADDAPVPILLPLGGIAAALDACGGDADAALWQLLGDVLDGPQGLRAGLRDHLTGALRRGGVLLLLDGLDELPASGGLRAQVAAAIRQLVRDTGAHVVVTSRVLPYRAAADWQFPADEGWAVRTLQPLAFGQVRAFVQGWYRALVPLAPELDAERAEARGEGLIAELETNQRLRPLVQSPLLLTMLALLHHNSKGSIPRDRARLYDECVQLLLERWEPARALDLHERPSRLQQLLARLPSLEVEKLREIIHRIAFDAHDAPPSDDGRGLIDRYRLTGQLLDFFKRYPGVEPSAAVDTLLEVIHEEAGLLLARDDETAYAFPHLTFQEYLAACWLADRAGGSGAHSMAGLAYARWQSQDRDRWREVLLLLIGRLRQQGKVEDKAVPWLHLLASSRLGGNAKPPPQARLDAVLAAQSYTELGGRAELEGTLLDTEALVERPLREAVVSLLAQPDPAIPLSNRIAAATVLGSVGDPRFPVTLPEWHSQPFPQTFGTPEGYWCFVRAGTYRIGGWEEGEPAADIALPAFWIARFPITVAQYAPFVQEGYTADAQRWWTPNGWRWKQESNRTQPWKWTDQDSTDTNQPVIGVSWYEAAAFCAWLNERLHGTLPEGYSLRLPTEAEWEAAAYDANGERHTYPWGEEEPTTERAIYDEAQLGRPAPVGCCPAGAASCGAHDIVGNVWEWMTSHAEDYPEQSNELAKDFTNDIWDVPLRGASSYNERTYICSASRVSRGPSYSLLTELGFRVIMSPRLAQ